jgi:hypothetical protein
VTVAREERVRVLPAILADEGIAWETIAVALLSGSSP